MRKSTLIRILSAVVLLTATLSFSHAQIIVDEDFESYTSDAAFDAAWPSSPSGQIGLLVPRTTAPFPPAPYDGTGDATTLPPVDPVVGQAIAFSDGGGFNEWAQPISVAPDSSSNVRYEADIFDFVDGNRRFSAGLRNSAAPANLLELGFWNADALDPTDGSTLIPTTGYAYRMVLFANPQAPLIQNPNWQYFQLPIEFDDPDVDHNNDGRFGDGDGIVNAVDVGPGWHRFSAEVSETSITVELDLFRDGTVDASQTWGIELAQDGAGDALPFDSLRIGGPSGVAMNEFTMIDNVKLELVPTGGGAPGDFDGNGAYDCADIDSLVTEVVAGTNGAMFDLTGDGNVNLDDVTEWLAEAGAAQNATGNPYLNGDANLDGVVDVADFNIWNNNKFASTGEWCRADFNADGVTDVGDFNIWNGNKFNASDVASVPEPSAGLLALLGMAVLVRIRRRR